jgi:hypothetical protein
MIRMIPPTSSASEMGLFMTLMAKGPRQDTRNDLRPPWGVTHQEVQRLQESNFVWMAAGRDMRIRGGARTRCLRAPKRL